MMLIPMLAVIQVVFVSVTGWAGVGGLEKELNQKLVELHNSIDHEHQTLEIKEIRFFEVKAYQAYIVYDISDKST